MGGGIHYMANRTIPYNELSNEDKIKRKKTKINRLFNNLPKEKRSFADDLIYQLAVTTVTLERLVDEINTGKVIEIFEQGSQKIRRENPALRAYNTTIKSFSALSKNLLDLLPDTAQKQLGEELMNFATKAPGAAQK